MLVFVIVLYKPEKHARFAMPMCRTPAGCSCKVSHNLFDVYMVWTRRLTRQLTSKLRHFTEIISEVFGTLRAILPELITLCMHVCMCMCALPALVFIRCEMDQSEIRYKSEIGRSARLVKESNQISWLVVAPAIVTMHQPSLSYMPCQPCQCECTLSRPSTIVRSEGDLQGWLVHSTR